jgi:uncharacterized membrane protein YkvA (DUF1232 family)
MNGQEPRSPDEIMAEVERGARAPISEAKAARFYDRIRARVAKKLPGEGGRMQDLLFFAPDVFILLWRLTRDARVTGKDKLLLGSALAYYVFPLDLMPDLLGPVGFMDDLLFGVYVLNRMLADTDEQVLRDHWSGGGDVLDVIRRVLKAADNLVASDVLKTIKKMVR